MPVYKNPDFRRPPPGLAAIFAKSGQNSFFDLPEWYGLLGRFGVSAGTEIRVYTDERPGSMIAVPLRVSEVGHRDCLISLANFYSAEHGLIVAENANIQRGLASILSEINAERPRWSCLNFSELDPQELSYPAVVNALRHAGFIVECTAGAATRYETTKDLHFTDYLTARPSLLRSTWRRKHSSIKAAGGLTAAFFSGTPGIERAIADYEAVYAASWKPPEPFPEFIPRLIRLAAELGALRLGIYYMDGMPAAAQFWILWRGRAIIYKLAHATIFDKLSLGTLLTMEMIERVLQHDRPYEINLGRGDDPYKSLWFPRRRERWGITAANLRTARGLWLGLDREAAKIYHWLRGDPIAPPAIPIRSDGQ
jgi:hypothetical protein